MQTAIAKKILARASSRNSGSAEVFLRSSRSTRIEVKDGTVDAFVRALDAGAGLRIIADNRLGFAFTTDLSDAGIDRLADAAATNARISDPDEFLRIPDRPELPYPAASVYDPAIAALTEKEKIERAMVLERAAYATDPRIKRIRKAAVSFSDSDTVILNSNGAEVAYQSTACSSSIQVVAEEKGESQSGSEFDVSRFAAGLAVEEVGRRAAQRAIDLLGARHIDSMQAPAIIEASVAQEFLSLMASGFSAESVQKKRSLFVGKLGQTIASPVVTILDDGLLEGGLGTAPCDDEAVPLTRKTVVNEGTLAMFLYNIYAAQKDGVRSTGNGMRGGFKGLPGVGVTNLSIRAGDSPLAELIGSVDRGLLVTDVMGMHTANAISGDFSVGATGFLIERGRKAYPVREITIAGNILGFMKQVEAVGSDLRFSGRIGSPSLLVKAISIGGK